MRLYRAVSQDERDDLVVSNKFRLNADNFAFGKWFAFSEQDAAAWGRWFASRDGLRYYVVKTEVSDIVAGQLTVRENLDNIGAAIFLTESQLSALPILSVSPALSDN